MRYPDNGKPKYYEDKYGYNKTDKEALQDRCFTAIICSGATVILISLSMTIALLLLRMIGYLSAGIQETSKFPYEWKVTNTCDHSIPFLPQSCISS